MYRCIGSVTAVTVARADVFDGLTNRRSSPDRHEPAYVSAVDLANMPVEYRHEPRHALEAGSDGLDVCGTDPNGRRALARWRWIVSGRGRSSADDLLAAFPELPFIWPELQHGGHGVFVLEAAGLS